MEPTGAPSDEDKGLKNGFYARGLSEIVKRIENPSFLFVIAIAILIGGLATLATALGISDLRFVVLVIALLALIVIIGYFIFEVRGKVVAQGEQLEAIRVALKGIVTKREVEHLRGVAGTEPYRHHWEPDLYPQLKRLDDNGFILPKEKGGRRSLIRIHDDWKEAEEHKHPDARTKFNVKDYVEITKAGEKYLELYNAVIEKPKGA